MTIPRRTVRIDDATWGRLKTTAKNQGRTVSDLLREPHMTVSSPPAGYRQASFTVREAGDNWVRTEAAKRSIDHTEIYRELMKLGMAEYRRGKRA